MYHESSDHKYNLVPKNPGKKVVIKVDLSYSKFEFMYLSVFF